MGVTKYLKFQGSIYRLVTAAKLFTPKEVLEHENAHGNDMHGYDAARFLSLLGPFDYFEVREVPVHLIEYPNPEEGAEKPLFAESENDEEWAQKYAQLRTKIPPVVITLDPDRPGKKYKLRFGRHRTRSAYLRGLKTVPAFVPVPEKGVLRELDHLQWKSVGDGATVEFGDHKIVIFRVPDREPRYKLKLDGKPLWRNSFSYTLDGAKELAVDYLSAKIRGVETRN